MQVIDGTFVELIEESFRELFPDKDWNHVAKIKYSGKFSSYNANVRSRGNELTFNLSKEWKGVDRGIKKGLIQTLLHKLYGKHTRQPKTLAIDLYNLFLKNAHLGAEKHTFEPQIEESFDRMNEEYLNGMLDKPNLVWGTESMRKLGSYEYGSDTISISTVLVQAPQELLDMVVYHEMLHKKFGFQTKNGRSFYHTPLFKRKEREFKDFDFWDKELARFLKRKKLTRWLSF